MSEENTTPAIYDGDSMELPPHVARNAVRWLMYQHGMTVDEANKTMTGRHSGPTRQRQRQEAIDVADFVEHVSK